MLAVRPLIARDCHRWVWMENEMEIMELAATDGLEVRVNMYFYLTDVND